MSIHITYLNSKNKAYELDKKKKNELYWIE